MLLGTLGSSLIGNLLSGRGLYRTGQGLYRTGQGLCRAGQGIKKSINFAKTTSFNKY